jgi:hypothetical protein
VIDSVAFNGTNLIISGTGGAAGGNYFVLSSADLSLPINQWQRIATNSFASDGSFSFTNAPDPNAPQTFYLLQLQ